MHFKYVHTWNMFSNFFWWYFFLTIKSFIVIFVIFRSIALSSELQWVNYDWFPEPFICKLETIWYMIFYICVKISMYAKSRVMSEMRTRSLRKNALAFLNVKGSICYERTYQSVPNELFISKWQLTPINLSVPFSITENQPKTSF